MSRATLPGRHRGHCVLHSVPGQQSCLTGWAQRVGHQQQAPKSFLKAFGQFGAGESPPPVPSAEGRGQKTRPPRALYLLSMGLVSGGPPFLECPRVPTAELAGGGWGQAPSSPGSLPHGTVPGWRRGSPSRGPWEELGGARVRGWGSPWPLRGLGGLSRHWTLSTTVSPEWHSGKEGCPALQATPTRPRRSSPTWRI